MASREPVRRRKKRPVLLSLLIALALLLAWLYRGCLGLGTGDGEPGERVDAAPPVTAPGGDAHEAPGGDAGGRIATPCELELTAEGLQLSGRATDVKAAVEACRRAGKASLRVTGDARTGTYMELQRALEQAGVPLDERQWPGRE